MRQYTKIALSLISFYFLSISGVNAQSCISGRVMTMPGKKPLAEANINASKNKGTISDVNGDFRICDLTGDSATVTISYLGYETKRIKAKLLSGTTSLSEILLFPELVNMDEVVVTATRTDNHILNTPVRVNLISPRQLASIPVQNIDEVLKYSPGINYNRPFGIYSTKAIVMMRGLSGKEQGRVLVLLDGIPLNKSDGGSVDWNLVDVNSVQKIEITKGAGSAVYGGNAMGGTINIITRKPEESLFVKASVEYGTFNTMGARLNTGGSLKVKNPDNGFFWLFNTFHKQSDGYISQSDAEVQANPYVVKSDMKEVGANLKTGYAIEKNQTIEASFNFYNDRRGTGEKVFQPEGNTTDHDSYGITVNYRAKFKSLNISSSVFNLNEDYKKVNEYQKDDYTWYEVLSTRRDYGWLTTFSYPVGKSQFVTAGFDYKNGSVDAYDKYLTSTDIVYNAGKMNTYALFAQDEINLVSDRIRLLAGLRFDMASFYDGSFRIEAPSLETAFMDEYQVPDMPVQNWNAFSPRLSGQFKWNKTSRVYAAYSRGFRPSVLDDLCRSGRIKGGFKIANPALKPEYLNNYEAGIDLKPFEKAVFAGSVYFSKGKDFQYYVTNGQTIEMSFGERPIIIRSNISEVEIYGAEAELKYDVLPGLNAFANYSFTHSVILKYNKISGNDTINVSGNHLTDVPDQIFTCGADFSHRLINAGVYLRYTGSMFINDQNTWDEILLSDRYPAFTMIDLKLWKPFAKHYKVSVNIQNLFDVKFYDSKYAVCPGRFITAEFSVNI